MTPNNQSASTPRKNVRSATAGPRVGGYTHVATVAQSFATMAQQSNLPPGHQLQPQPHTHRTLILAFDGTSNVFDETNTNVVKLFSLLRKDAPEQQLLYYQPGIGTYAANPGIWTPWLIKMAKAADLATAVYLDAHICAGYRFLIDHYKTGDKICLFGFSRGAYTARCLAGMLHKVGLLTPGNHEQIPFAYEIYRDTSPLGNHRGEGFKQTFSRPVNIEFMGVWDTVSSVGVLYGRHLPFTSSNQIIKTFRHALALDERRAKFKANVWHRSVPSAVAAKTSAKTKKAQIDPEHGTAIRVDTSNTDQAPWEVQTHGQEIAEQSPSEKQEGAGFVEEPTEGNSTNLKPIERKVEEEKAKEDDAASDKGTSALVSRDSLRRLLSTRSRHVTRQSTIDSEALMTMQGDHPDGGSPVHVCDCDRAGHTETNVLEVWFAGCHADVGGGSVPDSTPFTLGGPSLRWMVREMIDTGAGVLFDEAALVRMGIDPTPGAPRGLLQAGDQDSAALTEITEKHHNDSKVSLGTSTDGEQNGQNPRNSLARVMTNHGDTKNTKLRQEYLDALSPMYDQLKEAPVWWILEYLPIQWHFQDKEGKWHKRWRPNRSKPRVITSVAPVNIHVSVKMRMNAGVGYKPKAKYSGEPNWVE